MRNKACDILISVIFAALSVLVLLAVAFFVRPGEVTRNLISRTLTKTIDQHSNNAKADALGEQAYISKHYSIPLEDTVAPMPWEECFSQIEDGDAEAVQALIAEATASPLLDGQKLLFQGGTKIRYYFDDTLLAICWQEVIDGKTCSLCEVKIQDVSQFRRKLTGDSFETSAKDPTSLLARQANAVAAMSGDYYKFRDLGICVYQGELKRYSSYSFYPGLFNYNYIDTCMIDSSGDFRYIRKSQEISKKEVQQFIDDNQILFSLAFGPVLVDNYEICTGFEQYPIGEPEKHASRAAIGQLDTLHYLYLNVSWNNGTDHPVGDNFQELAEHIQAKGVRTAYNLDGGQSAEIVFQNEVYNDVDYGTERAVGDCIYFATANGNTKEDSRSSARE